MLRLNHPYLEHRKRIEGRASVLSAVAIAEPAGPKRPETLKLHCARQLLQWIIALAQPLKVLRQQKQAARAHYPPPFDARTETKYRAANHRLGVFAGVQLATLAG